MLSWLRLTVVLAICSSALVATADDREILLNGGKITMEAPKEWTRKVPKVRIIDHEFSAKAVGGDKTDARITIMGAGGSIDANIARWKGQFSLDGEPKIEKKSYSTYQVHLIDLQGKYFDRFGSGQQLPGYRMFGAIIVTKKSGRYYVKMTGPKETVAANIDNLKKTIESLKIR